MTELIDRETGEIIDAVHSRKFRNGTDEDKTVAVTVKQGEQVNVMKPKKFVKHADFTMVFHASNRELVRNRTLSDDEKSVLFSLLIYLDYDQYVKDEQSFFFNVNRVSELMSWSRRRTSAVLDGLTAKDKRLLAYTKIGREKYYMLNPNFIYRGDTSTLGTAIRLFEQAAIDDEEASSELPADSNM